MRNKPSKEQVKAAILAFNQRVRALTPETSEHEVEQLAQLSKEIDTLQGNELKPLREIK